MLHDHDDLDPILQENHSLGRTLTYLICTGMVMISIFTVSTVIASQGVGAAPTRMIRLVLTCLLAYGILIGSPAARWIWVVLSGIGGVILIIAIAPVFSQSPFAGLLILLLAIFYLGSAALLAFPTPVSRYVKYRRELRCMESPG